MDDPTTWLARHGAVYLWYVAASCLRYFAVAGSIYAFFHLWFPRRWLAHRIQRTFPEQASVRREIRWSMSSIACSGVASVLLYDLVHGGWTRMYFDVARYGWGWFVASVVLGIVAYDAWFYWQHRLLHTPWWFRHAHAVHHGSSNPTPFANFCHHPIEISLGNVFFIGFVMLVPIHAVAFGLVSMAIFGWGMVAHSGYELYPAAFSRHRAFRWLNSATHHNMHHSHVACNYGSMFNHWDRLMGTNHPAYRATFDATKAQNAGACPATA